MKSGRYEEALRWLYRANELDPNNVGIQFDIARTLQQLGRDRSAMDWYRGTIRLDRDGLRAHQNLAELLMKQGRVAQAIKHLEEVLRLDPHAPDIRERLEAARHFQTSRQRHTD